MSEDIRLTHVGLCVTDLDRSVSFFEAALGFRLVRRMHVEDASTAKLLDVDGLDLDLVYLERDGLCLELLAYRRPEVAEVSAPRRMDMAGFTHLSLRVRDPDAVAERIEAHGGSVLWDREVTFDAGTRGLMALDPDQNRIELIERRSR